MASFTGGEKLEAYLKDLGAKLGRKDELRVGFLENSSYPDGTSVPMVAAIQEFGAPAKNIPPRPFFRSMIAAESGHWGEDLAKLLKKTDYDVDQSLAVMGEVISGELRQSIDDTNSPPLKESTAAAKGFNKPLVDTGHMRNSIDFEIKE